MAKPIWKKSVVTDDGVIDISAWLDDQDGDFIEIESGGFTMTIRGGTIARSLAGSIAAAAAKIEASRKALN